MMRGGVLATPSVKALLVYGFYERICGTTFVASILPSAAGQTLSAALDVNIYAARFIYFLLQLFQLLRRAIEVINPLRLSFDFN
jgi:hypothetical protein